MTTFERRLIKDESAWTEPKNAYYTYYQDPAVCDALLKEFGLEGPHCHIINGHIPVKSKKGESPIKGGGKLLVIDGGFCRAYQPTTGIAGYTLIYNSWVLRLVSHQPFCGQRTAIEENVDIASSSMYLNAWRPGSRSLRPMWARSSRPRRTPCGTCWRHTGPVQCWRITGNKTDLKAADQ